MLSRVIKMRELFSCTRETETLFFRYAKGPSVEPGKEFHPIHEILYFMGGDGEFISEDIHCRLTEGTVIIIPKETYHQLVLHGDPNAYLRCSVKFKDRSAYEGILNRPRLVAADRDMQYLFAKMIDCREEADASQVMEAALTLILSALLHKQSASAEATAQSAVVQKALSYINDHLYEDISTQLVAKQCMISESSLSHIFKKEMGIPLHRFIVKKRLISAYRKIADGEPATKVALACGFADYSGFYKQYKKMFGASPQSKKA
jgi:AraC-like DNA-binding protein